MISNFPSQLSVMWHLWENLGLLVKIKFLTLTCDMMFVFQLFFPKNYILTVIIIFAFLYHLHAETQKIPCSVFSAWSNLALLWSSSWLQCSPMEYCWIANLFSTKEIKALHCSPEARDKLYNASHRNSHMHKGTHAGSKFLWWYFWPVCGLEKIYAASENFT